MTGIGLRVYSNKKVYFTIIEHEKDEYSFLTTDHVVVPLSMTAPERLNYIRNTIVDIILEYDIDTALLRVKESMFSITKLDVERLYIEGVLLESLAGSTVSKYRLGQISSITKLLGMERTDFKLFAGNEKLYTNIPEEMDWSSLSKEERESIMACQASLNL